MSYKSSLLQVLNHCPCCSLVIWRYCRGDNPLNFLNEREKSIKDLKRQEYTISLMRTLSSSRSNPFTFFYIITPFSCCPASRNKYCSSSFYSLNYRVIQQKINQIYIQNSIVIVPGFADVIPDDDLGK